jgi:hypothetical protein
MTETVFRVQYEEPGANPNGTPKRWVTEWCSLAEAEEELVDVAERRLIAPGWKNVTAVLITNQGDTTMAAKKTKGERWEDAVEESAKSDAAAKAAPRKKQLPIPGTERKHHKDVSEAADDYVAVRDERMALARREIETRAVLMDRMKRHKITRYVDDDFEIEIVSVDEKLKVKRLADSAGDEE